MTDSEHYHTDRNGDMWVNISQIREEGGFELGPIEPGGPAELQLEVSDILVTKKHPTLHFVLDEETHNKLASMKPTNYDSGS